MEFRVGGDCREMAGLIQKIIDIGISHLIFLR